MAVAYPDIAFSAVGGDVVEMPQGVVLGSVNMSRDGTDLLVETAGGQEVLIEDYFTQEPRPDLMDVDGARIAGSIVQVLAGPELEAVAPEVASVEPVGAVHTMSGTVFVVRANGARVEALVDMPLFQGDVLETLGDGAIGVVLSDETSFAMSGDGVMVLDELIYDPAEQEGSLSLFLMRGMATVTSGMISKTDPDGMVIDTPVGTVGIRGTQIGIDATQGDSISIIMMEEADGYIGEVTFTNPAGILVMNQAYQVIGVTAGRPPVFAPTVNADIVTSTFGHNLVHLPLTHGAANDYSVQEPEGGGELDVESEIVPEPAPTSGVESDEPADRVDEETPVSSVTQVVAEEPVEPLQPVEAVMPEVEIAPEESGPVVGGNPPAPEVRSVEIPPAPVESQPDFGVGLNYPPVAFPDTVSVREDESLNGQLQATDADQDVLSFALAENGGPANGSVTLNPDGTYVYTPAPDFSGTDTFTFSVSDGQGGVTESTVTLQVLPVAATPTLTVSDVSAGEPAPGVVIEGSRKDDELVGTAGSDTIHGDRGDDVIYGDSGVLSGGTEFPLQIQVGLEEGENVADINISLQGVPGGATLSAGTDQGDGVWSLAPDDLEGLNMTLPEDHEGDFSLTVEAIHTDMNPDLDVTDTATSSAVINVSLGNAGGDDILYGDQGEDVIYGGAGDDEIEGGQGEDVLYGGAGDDEIEGGQGEDVIYGGAGDDVIEGGKGDDVIVGGEGDDILLGNEGFDQFIFGLDAGEDAIADYKLGEQIRFEGPEFSDVEPQITGNDNGGVSILFDDHNVEVTVDNVDLSQQSYTITPSDDGLTVVFDNELES